MKKKLNQCRCGCGEPTAGTWAPGHDQRAIQERVTAVGGAEKFCDWFDQEARAQRAMDALFESAKMTHEDGTLYGEHPQP